MKAIFLFITLNTIIVCDSFIFSQGIGKQKPYVNKFVHKSSLTDFSDNENDVVKLADKIIDDSYELTGISIDKSISSVTSEQNNATNIEINDKKSLMTTFEFYGDIPPLGFFDPLNIAKSLDETKLKYFRESEIHHGRLAMLSIILLPIIDLLDHDNLAINSLRNSNIYTNFVALLSMAFVENSRMIALYKKPIVDNKLMLNNFFALKEDVQPGKLNPYGKVNINLANKELSNGRLAMIASIGYIVQELTTNSKIFHT